MLINHCMVHALPLHNLYFLPAFFKHHNQLSNYSSPIQDLLEKMSGFEFPWRPVIMVTLVAVVGFMTFDFYTHNGFQGKSTIDILK